jgi:hypothetical protein
MTGQQPGILSLQKRLKTMFPQAQGDILILVADNTLTASQYENSEPLIWRDAGALMQTLHICATAFRLNFCPAGISGSELIAPYGESGLMAAGVAVVGRPKT